MIVKVDLFVQLEGGDVIDPRMVQRFMSKLLGEKFSIMYGPNRFGDVQMRLSPEEFKFLKQLGIKSDSVFILTEEQALTKLK
jgi:hypothetical protein